MFTLDAVKEELEKAKIDPVTSKSAQDYAALIIIHDHLCKRKEEHGYRLEDESEEAGEYKPFDKTMPLRNGSGDRVSDQPSRSHYQDGQQREHGQPLRAGGTFWMEPAQEAMPFNRQVAEEWVEHMENSDPSHPRGGKWTPEDLKPLAHKLGFPEDGEKFWEFYAMMNAMYSDYAPVAKKFGITSPEFYACMAKAWMEDKDAKEDKTALYYKYIVDRKAA